MPNESARSHRYAEVKKRIALSGDRGLDREALRPYPFSAYS
jgi:hypothetical protein